jgi:hypothetical protein
MILTALMPANRQIQEKVSPDQELTNSKRTLKTPITTVMEEKKLEITVPPLGLIAVSLGMLAVCGVLRGWSLDFFTGLEKETATLLLSIGVVQGLFLLSFGIALLKPALKVEFFLLPLAILWMLLAASLCVFFATEVTTPRTPEFFNYWLDIFTVCFFAFLPFAMYEWLAIKQSRKENYTRIVKETCRFVHLFIILWGIFHASL